MNLPLPLLLLRALGVTFAAAFAVAACSDDHGHDDGHHAGLADECQAIIDACHTKDDGTPGELHDCHQTAHDVRTAAACGPIQANCVALCNAAPSVEDGGAGYEL